MSNVNLKLRITVMTCEHCASTAEAALNVLPGIQARVSFQDALARIEMGAGTEISQLLDAVQVKGYDATLIEENDDDGVTADEGSVLKIAIIGSGSGAFAAAIRSADEGAQATLIEGNEVIGGSCVNVGCVPSKIMIRAAHIAHLQATNPFEGLENQTPVIDRGRLVNQQQARIEELRLAKYENILETNPNIQLIKGWARFQSANRLVIEQADGQKQNVTADRIRFIKRAQDLGFTLNEITDLLSLNDGNCEEARTIAEHKREVIQQRIEDLNAMQRELTNLIEACKNNIDGHGHCAIIKALTKADSR